MADKIIHALVLIIAVGTAAVATILSVRAESAYREITRKSAIPSRKRTEPMTGVEKIAAERERQVSIKGWTPEHDDKHDSGSLVAAAVTYALEATYDGPAVKGEWFKKFWCFEDSWFKPSGDKVRDLVKAGALIAAEIDRLQRLED